MAHLKLQELKVWQKSRELRMLISSLLSEFPESENFALSAQIKRSSRSIGDNIAEGYGRHHDKENMQFCRIARGSAYELLNQMITSLDEGYINEDEFKKVNSLIEEVIKMLNGFIRYLRNRTKNKINEPTISYGFDSVQPTTIN